MTIQTLHEILDCAWCVVVDEDRELIAVWNGGRTVNIYTAEGEAVDCFSLDYNDPKPDAQTAQAEMIAYLRGEEEEL